MQTFCKKNVAKMKNSANYLRWSDFFCTFATKFNKILRDSVINCQK